MVSISGTIIDMGNSLAPVGTVTANGLASILHIFIQFLPAVITFSIILYLVNWIFGLSVGGLFKKKKKIEGITSDNLTFSSRQKNK